MKINQIWALAILKKWELNGIIISVILSTIMQVSFFFVGLTMVLPFRFPLNPLNNQKSSIKTKILNALSNFIPAEKHFRTGQTDLGIEVDAEFIINDKGIPLPFADYIGKSLPANSAR